MFDIPPRAPRDLVPVASLDAPAALSDYYYIISYIIIC